jgi:RNA polymerase sigma-70 factor (ECF subfamily)
VLGNAAEAEEIVQETFLEAWRRADSYDVKRGTVATWLFAIGTSRAIDRLRARSTRQRTIDEIGRAGGDGPVMLATPEVQAEAAQARKRVADALDILPPEQRAVVELAYFDGLSQSEIAARTGHPLGTIKGRARAALEKLAEHLTKGAP